MSAPNAHDWIELLRSLGPAGFAKKHAGWFLLSTDDADEASTLLQTLTMDPRKRAPRTRGLDLHWVHADSGAAFVTVGRSRECDIRFPHPSISKVHARLEPRPRSNGLVVIDLGSLNGTWLNGDAVPANEPKPLANRDRLYFGSVQTMVLTAKEAAAALLPLL